MSPLSWLWPAKVEEKKPSPTGWLERINYIQREHRTIVAFGSAVAITFIAFSLHGRFRKRCPNGGWVTPDMMGTGRRLKGVVTSVGDGDGFRFYHLPAIRVPFYSKRWPFNPKNKKELQSNTISVRIAGVDAPEGSHFGRQKQVHYGESLQFLKDRVEGRVVVIEPMTRDQYNRIVAHVYVRPWYLIRQNLALEMLRGGHAVLYEQRGAFYSKKGKEYYREVEANAQAAKRGIWQNGVDIETPSQWKGTAPTLEPSPIEPPVEPSIEEEIEPPRKRAKAKMFP